MTDNHLSFLDPGSRVDIPVDDVYWWLDQFEQYIVRMEGFLEDECAAIQKRYRDLPEFAGHPLELLEHVFPNILRRSAFVATYSLAEAELDDRCSWASKRLELSPSDLGGKGSKKPRLSLSDLSGKGIKRARKYLERVAGVGFPDSAESLWGELNDYRRIRNCLAHSQGRLTSNADSKHLRQQYLPKHKQHLYLDDDEIVLRQGFCEEVIKTLRAFFQELDKA